jgi:hypothetical protein
MTDAAIEVESEEGFPVRMPSGAMFYVLTGDEVAYLEERVQRYLKDNHFINISDFQDIDRMLEMELLVHRWSLWLSRQKDYYGEPIDEKTLAQTVNSYSSELRLLKKNLGIDKVARDKQRGDDSVAVYLDNLRQRALEFGVMRNDQFDKAIELMQQLVALVTYHDNCDEIERIEQHVTQDDLMEWLRTVAIPEFEAIDEEFRTTKQKLWIRAQ